MLVISFVLHFFKDEITLKRTTISPDFAQIYRSSFRLHAHLLVLWGYQQAQQVLTSDDEEEISDLLYQNIHRLLMFEREGWMAQYAVKNEDPISGIGGVGRKRREIDLLIEFAMRDRPQYVFEAKVLNWGKRYQRTSNYVDKNGIGRFIEGEYADYTARFPEIGMLGYVKSDSLEEWQERLQTHIDLESHNLRLCGPQENVIVCEEIKHEWISRHERLSPEGEVTIYHILLDCQAQG